MAGTQEGWSVCPGCGLALPGPPGLAGRSNASAACWQLYGEVQGYETQHLARLGRFHQLMVDAYASQHAGGSARPISTAFGLLGLELALVRHVEGSRVRAIHQYLGDCFSEWPAFAPPELRADLTVFDVASAGSFEAHGELVQRWAAAVWAVWRPAHGQVVALLEERLPPDIRERLLASD
ncbi:MAG: DUF5946 family protein [Candidatus Limnocylindrales bacterium]